MLSNLFCVALLFIGGEAGNWRVVNGRRGVLGQFPFMAFISTSKHGCSGSILDRYTVATAAHCVCKGSSATVTVGVIDREDKSIWSRQNHYSSRIFIHPKYDNCNGPHPLDIAIIKLKTAIQFNSVVQPISLFCEQPKTNRLLVQLGYGYDENKKAGVLNYAYNKVHYDCDPGYICSRKTPNHIDQGDSGGPMLVMEKIQLKQAGVNSGGDSENSAYANVPKACSWIKSKME